MTPADERYNMSATSGRDNAFAMTLSNDGSDAITNIAFSSDKPEGWSVSFSPENIESLATAGSQTVDVKIKPPPRTIAGDYVITLKTEGKQTAAANIQVRVTVETPTIWGWVGVAIIVLVVTGVMYIFMRFSRR